MNFNNPHLQQPQQNINIQQLANAQVFLPNNSVMTVAQLAQAFQDRQLNQQQFSQLLQNANIQPNLVFSYINQILQFVQNNQFNNPGNLGMNQGFMQQHQMHQGGPGRFNTGRSQGLAGHITQPVDTQPLQQTSRFNQRQPPRIESEPVQDETKSEIEVLEIQPLKNISFNNNSKVKLNTVSGLINSLSVKRNDPEHVIIANSFEEAIEDVLENSLTVTHAYELILNDVVHCNTRYNGIEQKDIEVLFSKDMKHLYRSIKALFGKATTRQAIIDLDFIDDMMVKQINDYLRINTSHQLQIESFVNDYNELFNVMRTDIRDAELEDQFVDTMNLYIETIRSNLVLLTETFKDEAKTDGNNSIKSDDILKSVVGIGNLFKSYIPEILKIGCSNKHYFELGFQDLVINKTYLVNKEHEPNSYLISMAGIEKDFYCVTLDRSLYHIQTAVSGEVYITRIK